MDKKIVINILPQDPEAWLFIAIAVIAASFFWCTSGSSRQTDVERERTRRIEKLIEVGYTNAVMEEIKREIKEIQ